MLWITLHELQALLKISISGIFQGILIPVQCTIYRITHKRRRVQVPAEKELFGSNQVFQATISTIYFHLQSAICNKSKQQDLQLSIIINRNNAHPSAGTIYNQSLDLNETISPFPIVKAAQFFISFAAMATTKISIMVQQNPEYKQT